MKFSDAQKEQRELKRNNKYSSRGFSEIYNLATIGYGGTKPQNISVLNNSYGGKAKLLMSTPPQLDRRDAPLPSLNFFQSSLRYYDIHPQLKKIHGIFSIKPESSIPRQNQISGLNQHIEDILDVIIQTASNIRTVSRENKTSLSKHLPTYQRVWLCATLERERKEGDDWLDELCKVSSQWIALAYKKVIKKPIVLGPAEHDFIFNVISSHREALR